MSLDDDMRAVAEAQHSVIARRQIRELGGDHRMTARRLRGPDWEALTSRVLRLVGSQRSDGQQLMAGVLDAGPGAVLSETSAAQWWGIPGFRVDPVHVTRDRGRRTPSSIAVVHQVVDLLPHHLTALHGIPIVRPERLAFELFATLHPGRATRATETMWSKGLLSGASLRSVHAELTDRGREGTVALREYLAARPDDYIPPASGLESRFERILADAGEAPMRRQVPSGGDRWVGRVDYRDERVPLIVEIQSERYHAALIDREADAVRVDALDAAGFMVLEVWDVEIWNQPRAVVERVRAARRALRQQAA